jgi:hypothetical protein
LAHDQFLCEEVFFTQELALAVTTGNASSQHMFSPQPPASTTDAGFSPLCPDSLQLLARLAAEQQSRGKNFAQQN